mmetsp:Transcript_69691/g.203967  ORF Transcript_69691/g.203967 Transcript_69691/m.203967 type:complete len:249 (+) Transcript_69691:133-879(+)
MPPPRTGPAPGRRAWSRSGSRPRGAGRGGGGRRRWRSSAGRASPRSCWRRPPHRISPLCCWRAAAGSAASAPPSLRSRGLRWPSSHRQPALQPAPRSATGRGPGPSPRRGARNWSGRRRELWRGGRPSRGWTSWRRPSRAPRARSASARPSWRPAGPPSRGAAGSTPPWPCSRTTRCCGGWRRCRGRRGRSRGSCSCTGATPRPCCPEVLPRGAWCCTEAARRQCCLEVRLRIPILPEVCFFGSCSSI